MLVPRPIRGGRLYAAIFVAFCLTLSIVVYTQLDADSTLSPYLSHFSPFAPDINILEPLNTTSPAPRVLIVSAFFPLSKSKHSMSEYEAWLTRFLSPITTDIYMFAPPTLAPMIRALRGDLPLTLNTTFASPFDIPPLQGRAAAYRLMHAWDPEQDIHSPELYAVWTAKPYFLDEGLANAQAAGQQYDYAFWNDAGSFREEHTYVGWPDGRRVDQVFRQAARLSGTPQDEIVFFPLWWAPERHSEERWWVEARGPIDMTFAEGSFFGGMPRAVRTYRHTYFTYHDYYLANSLFVGKDQNLINALTFLFPSHFAAVWIYDTKARAHRGVPDDAETQLGSCGSSWYYYQWWFAEEQERERMADVWMAEEKDRGKGLHGLKVRCRMTDVLIIEQLLRRQFGKGWTPPAASVDVLDL
ncbi:hypothetical protein DENSPDRAFT_860780 [Dentipellis sp. KUC8613]|nr:hypothetical protein DENSPDRAFT_860780 [Dentipellis sp. KUC8613]